jgi:hypothetical protein
MLSGSGASASCAVFFTSFPRGGQAITASYGGDAAHDKSTGITLVAVEVPASTDGCLVFGHGRITATNGDRASFRGLAVASPPRGASVFGRTRMTGGSVEYRIDVQLAAWEWGKDTYRIRLSSGYDSGAQPIRHGDLDIRLRDRDHQHHDTNANQNRGQQDGG